MKNVFNRKREWIRELFCPLQVGDGNKVFEKALSKRARFFANFKKSIRKKYKRKKAQERNIVDAFDVIRESLKPRPDANKFREACQDLYETPNQDTLDSAAYQYRQCFYYDRKVKPEIRNSIFADSLPGTLRTYTDRLNTLDYQLKDATLNPDVNVDVSCSEVEQKHSECEQTYGINAKECDKWLEMFMNECVSAESSCSDIEQKHSECEQKYSRNAKECDKLLNVHPVQVVRRSVRFIVRIDM